MQIEPKSETSTIRFQKKMNIVLTQLWHARSSVILIMILYILFLHVEQVQDIIASFGQNGWQRMFYIYLTTSLMAILVWVVTKKFLVRPQELIGVDNLFYISTQKAIPYIFASMIPLIIAAGAFYQIAYLNKYSGSRFFYLIGIIALSIFIEKLTTHYFPDKTRAKKIVYYIIFIFIVLSVFGVINDRFDSTYGLHLVGAGMILTSFLVSLILRPSISDALVNRKYNNFTYENILIYGVIAAFGVLFILNNIFPDRLGTFPIHVVYSGLAVYYFIVSYLIYKKTQDGRFYLSWIIAVLFLISIVNNNWIKSNHHDVRICKGDEFHRIWDTTYIINKFGLRDTSAKPKSPIYFILGEGGGSRAGLWMHACLDQLEQMARERNSSFMDHVAALSTVSGSTTGTGVFLQARIGEVFGRERYKSFYEQNYLSSSLAYLMGRDFLYGVLPLNCLWSIRDRAAQLEDEWASHADKINNGNNGSNQILNKGYLNYWYPESTDNLLNPIWIINSYNVESGRWSFWSPVLLMNDSASIDLVAELPAGRMVKMISAMHTSSRFPYINSAGKINPKGHFVDGGYFDNYGSMAMLRLLDNLSKCFAELDIRIILIKNSYPERESKDKELINVNQIFAPVQGVINTKSGHTRILFDELVHHSLVKDCYILQLNYESLDTMGRPLMPLGRILSERAVNGILAGLETNGNKRLFEEIVQSID